MNTQPAPAVVLFDGVCNLCDGVVNFLIDRDPKANLRFASLQSEAGRALLVEAGLPPGYRESFVLLGGGIAFVGSDAAPGIARHMVQPWSLLYGLRRVLRPLRDAAYRFIARHRYQWFGLTDACRLPTPELRARFL